MTGALVAVVTLAGWWDVRERRIPNVLTVGGLALALLLRGLLGGAALADGLQGAGLALLCVAPLFALGVFGGGDAKLLIALGGFTGPKGLLFAVLASGVVGGLMAVWWGIRHGALLGVVFRSLWALQYCVTFGRSGHRPDAGTSIGIPYGVAIAVGALLVWFAQGVQP